MRFRTNWLEVSYERRFRQPSFDIAATPATVLRALHEAISPRYPLSSADLAVEAGRSVADVRLKATLFGGNGLIEVTADSFSGSFRNAIGPGDVQKVQDCVALGLGAVESAVPNLALAAGSITSRLFVELIDEPHDAHVFLRELMASSGPHISFREVAGVECIPGMKTDLINAEQKWEFVFQLDRALRSRNELFVLLVARYEQDGAYRSVDEQAKHFGECVVDSLSRVGLVAETEQ